MSQNQDSKIDLGHSIRLELQNEYLRRCRRNSSYSMRAFAKFLDIDQSLLSKIMRSQRAVSAANVYKIGQRLGLKPSKLKSLAGHRDAYGSLSDDEFEFLSEWFYFAILELMKTKSFRPDPKYIARRLGIKVDEARAALERLCRLGLVESDGVVLKLRSRDNSWSNTKNTSGARRQLQKKLLQRSVEAIDTIPFALRDNGSLTVAIDPKRLCEFKEKLVRIRKELGEFFQESGELTEVYQLTLSFFPLTKIEENQR